MEVTVDTLSEREQHGLPDEPCAPALSVDEIVALEDRIQRTAELVSKLCQALTAAQERALLSEMRAAQTEEWALKAKAHVQAYAPVMEQMQNELSVLRGERDNVRQRVETLQVEVHGYASAMGQMESELSVLRGERDHVRQRVERMLAQLDALALSGDRSLENRVAALVTV